MPFRDPKPPQERCRSGLGRALDVERRAGPEVNRRMVRLYEMLFIILGPTALAFGCFAVAKRAWIGGLLVVLGLWWTVVGFRRLHRLVEAKRRGQSETIDEVGRAEPVQSISGEHPLHSRAGRLIGGSVLIVVGVLVIVLALVR